MKNVFGFRLTKDCKDQIKIKLIFINAILILFGTAMILSSKIFPTILFFIFLLLVANISIIYNCILEDLTNKKNSLSCNRKLRKSKGVVKAKYLDENSVFFGEEEMLCNLRYDDDLETVNFRYIDLINNYILSFDLEKFKNFYKKKEK